jgi:hypothetical protein
MKFVIKGNQKKVMEVCDEILKIKDSEGAEIKKSGLKQKAADGIVNFASSASGMSLDDAFSGFTIFHEPKGDDEVILNIPMYIPRMVRFILKRKLEKSFREIFEKAMEGEPVKVKFLSWGDEDIKKG